MHKTTWVVPVLAVHPALFRQHCASNRLIPYTVMQAATTGRTLQEVERVHLYIYSR
jgi:hypothetical protein